MRRALLALAAAALLAGCSGPAPAPVVETPPPAVETPVEPEPAIPDTLPEPAIEPTVEPEPVPLPNLRLRAVGDLQLGRAWPEKRVSLPPGEGDALFNGVRHLLHDADLTFGNLETVLADSGSSYKCRDESKNCYAFRVPTAFARAVDRAGFDLLSTANNHAGDFGGEGRASTAAALDSSGLLHSGPLGDVAVTEVNGVSVAMIAFSTGPVSPRVTEIDLAVELVAELDAAHDIVIVSFHGGAEGGDAQHVPQDVEIFYGENRGDVHAFARAVIDAGADAVLGHGPHVLRAMEMYEGRFIAYSLGNFCAWHTYNLRDPRGRSVVLELELRPDGSTAAARVLPLRLTGPGIPEPDPSGRAVELIRTLSLEDLGVSVLDAEGSWIDPDSSN